MKQKAKLGDLFYIPIDESRSGIGQIAGDWKGELYVVVYDINVSDRNIDPSLVFDISPLFSALTLDAKLYNGDWPIFANCVGNLKNIAQPIFKVNEGAIVFVESRDRSMTRPATEAEAKNLRFRTVVAPVRLEKALKAHYGSGDWSAKYDELSYGYAFESSRMLQN